MSQNALLVWMAVSYTHLDVYKRQPQNVPEPLPSSETPFKPPVLEQHGVSSHTGTVIAETVVTHKPVSYTHLDVYKRQVTVLQTLVIALGAGLAVWGVINLMEGYGNDNPAAKSQGINDTYP